LEEIAFAVDGVTVSEGDFAAIAAAAAVVVVDYSERPMKNNISICCLLSKFYVFRNKAKEKKNTEREPQSII
jgi:hypothetical protein